MGYPTIFAIFGATLRYGRMLGRMGDLDGSLFSLFQLQIGSIKFLRSEGYQAYFNHLDRAGGFFYER